MAMFKFGKKRKQNCIILTEDGRIIEDTLPVVKGYVVDRKTQEAWTLFPGSLIPERGTGRVDLLVCERDAAPINVNGDNPHKLTTETISAIASENADEALAQIHSKSLKNKLAGAIHIAVIAFSITICLMVIFGLISMGKLHLPDLGGIFG